MTGDMQLGADPLPTSVGFPGQVSGESRERKPVPLERQEVLLPPGQGSREAPTAPHKV